MRIIRHAIFCKQTNSPLCTISTLQQILKLPNTNPPSLGCPESLTPHPFETSIHGLTFASSRVLTKS